ncbi:MAG: hypothetical protein AB8I08_40495 [Sandaracinaceae bacterium]
MPLTKITNGLWTTQSSLNFFGVPMSATTTLAELGDGGLLVVSPGAIDDALRRQVDALGEVRAIAAPNQFHHMFIDGWRAAYPDASLHVPTSLRKKRPDLAEAAEHTAEAPSVYADAVGQLPMQGLPFLDETWFLHRPSRTLIDTDLMHNTHEDPSWIARSGWKMMGAWKRFGPSRLERLLVKDRAALAECVETALTWEFDRVIVAHGEVLEVPDARDRVRASWSWLLR